MLIPFDEMPKSARVWIYQADRSIVSEEREFIEKSTADFLNGWAAHNQALKSSYSIFHNKFLVLTVDESFNLASGCSIDASVHFVQELGEKLGINFFDRTKVAFLLDGEIFESSMNEMKSLVADGKINAETLTFNNLVPNLDEFENQWQVPTGKTWLSRYL